MTRVFARRTRILPGPLRVVSAAERSTVPVASLALTAAFIAAGLALMPQLSPRYSVDPTPMAEVAQAAPAEPQAAASPASETTALVAATVEPVIPAAPALPQAASADAAPGSARSALAPRSKPAGPAPAKSAVDQSLFQLDLLPVLRDDGTDLDAGATAQRPATKPVSRRTGVATRGAAVAATGGPARP